MLFFNIPIPASAHVHKHSHKRHTLHKSKQPGCIQPRGTVFPEFFALSCEAVR